MDLLKRYLTYIEHQLTKTSTAILHRGISIYAIRTLYSIDCLAYEYAHMNMPAFVIQGPPLVIRDIANYMISYNNFTTVMPSERGFITPNGNTLVSRSKQCLQVACRAYKDVVNIQQYHKPCLNASYIKLVYPLLYEFTKGDQGRLKHFWQELSKKVYSKPQLAPRWGMSLVKTIEYQMSKQFTCQFRFSEGLKKSAVTYMRRYYNKTDGYQHELRELTTRILHELGIKDSHVHVGGVAPIKQYGKDTKAVLGVTYFYTTYHNSRHVDIYIYTSVASHYIPTSLGPDTTVAHALSTVDTTKQVVGYMGNMDSGFQSETHNCLIEHVTAHEAFCTAIHEVTHACDYALMNMRYSPHTSGFYRRMHNIMRALLPAEFVQMLKSSSQRINQKEDANSGGTRQ